jgi:hypothetical protein
MPHLVRACNADTNSRRLVIAQLSASSSSSSSSSSDFPDNQIVNSVYGSSCWEIALTTLPKSFAEQFRRPLNLYFLLIASLQLWPEITPVNPLTTWGPLVFVLTLTAVRTPTPPPHSISNQSLVISLHSSHPQQTRCMIDDLERCVL